jgi:hypothetical protein
MGISHYSLHPALHPLSNTVLDLQPIPNDNPQPDKSRQDTKHQRNNAPSLESLRQPPRIPVLAAQIRQVQRIPCCIALGRHISIFAAQQVVLRDLTGKLGLDVQGRLDDGGDEPGRDVPFDVAVEEPHTRVVGAKSEDGVAVGVDEDRVAAHRGGREVFLDGGVVEAGFIVAAMDDLESVAVEMEGVSAVGISYVLALMRRWKIGLERGVMLTFRGRRC